MAQFRLLTQTRQMTEYSCGASAMQAVLRYWGREVDEDALMKLMGTNDEVGTYPEEMVRGVTRLLNAQLGIAVTGIAGPGGGTPEKPVGLVYIAVSVDDHVTVSRSVFPGDRSEIRGRAAQIALNRLRIEMTGSEVV